MRSPPLPCWTASKRRRDLGIASVVTYDRFGTAMVPLPEGKLEFVGARKERYNESSRNPEVTPATLEEDLARRDFTVNALAVSLNAGRFGELQDPHGGVQDLEARILRAVVGGDFEKRYITLLRKRGVDLEGLQIVPTGRTFHWSGYYEGDMNRAITRATP